MIAKQYGRFKIEESTTLYQFLFCEGVVDRLLKKDFYELFNSWYQKKWGVMPEYELYGSREGYHCTLRFLVISESSSLK